MRVEDGECGKRGKCGKCGKCGTALTRRGRRVAAGTQRNYTTAEGRRTRSGRCGVLVFLRNPRRVSFSLRCPLRASASLRPSACQSSFRSFRSFRTFQSFRAPRAAYTLAELLVALTIGGVTLAIVTSIAVRQQRTFADLADAAALSAQLHDVRAILPLDVRSIAPAAGDIRDASDTAFEFRMGVASAVVCDTVSPNVVILAPATSASSSLTSVAVPIEANDTLWALAANDSTEDWRPAQVTAVGTAAAGSCGAGGPLLDDVARSTTRTSLALSAPIGASGTPVRVTRPVRYSLYRASDGAWYVGQRDWNNSTLKLNAIQPVAGPFLSAAQGGLRFTFSDSTGAVLRSPVANRASIATVRVDVRGQTRNVQRAFGSPHVAGASGIDSSSVTVRVRNRR